VHYCTAQQSRHLSHPFRSVSSANSVSITEQRTPVLHPRSLYLSSAFTGFQPHHPLLRAMWGTQQAEMNGLHSLARSKLQYVQFFYEVCRRRTERWSDFFYQCPASLRYSLNLITTLVLSLLLLLHSRGHCEITLHLPRRQGQLYPFSDRYVWTVPIDTVVKPNHQATIQRFHFMSYC